MPTSLIAEFNIHKIIKFHGIQNKFFGQSSKYAEKSQPMGIK